MSKYQFNKTIYSNNRGKKFVQQSAMKLENIITKYSAIRRALPLRASHVWLLFTHVRQVAQSCRRAKESTAFINDSDKNHPASVWVQPWKNFLRILLIRSSFCFVNGN